jgi:hypothetical protein
VQLGVLGPAEISFRMVDPCVCTAAGPFTHVVKEVFDGDDRSVRAVDRPVGDALEDDL